MATIFHKNSAQTKLVYNAKCIIRDKEGHFIMIKGQYTRKL